MSTTKSKAMKKNKYGARKVTVNGETFDSQGEYSRWCVLKLREKAGEITDLTRQVKRDFVHNGVKITSYASDFEYIENGELVVEDFKSKITAAKHSFKIKVKLMKAFYNIDVKVVMK